jgi:predicted phosphodiesterase
MKAMRVQAQNLGVLSLAKPASFVPAIVSGVAQFCFERLRVVDGIIISGDLATTGTGVDLSVARAFVDESSAGGFTTEGALPTLQASRRPIYVMAGNHDRYANNFATTNSRTFDLAFQDYLRNYNGFVGHWVRKKREQHFGFVFADFTLRTRMDGNGKLGAFGQGRVYDDILDELRSRTFRLRADYPEIVLNWMVHFAPYDCGSSLELIDWDKIVDAATAAGVVSTICGHTHSQRKIQAPGHVIYCAGSSGCADSEHNSTVHILRYSVEAGQVSARRENFKWNSRALSFERQADD